MKNVLNYFVRKAFGFKSTATAEDKTLFGHLLRIRQNIQGVYDWLYARCPADAWWLARRMPMTEAVSADGSSGSTPVKLRPVLQNSDNLLAHLRLLDNRKITNGYADGTPADDGLPDGVSLARLLCDSSLQPTELIDDNIGWVMDKKTTLPTQTKVAHFNCTKVVTQDSPNIQGGEEVHLDALETSDHNANGYAVIMTKRVFLNAYKRGIFRIGGSGGYTNGVTRYIYVGCRGGRTDSIRFYNYCYHGGCVLEKVELRQGARQPFTLDCPSFQVADPYVNMTAENIVSGILEPLADNNYEDDGVTKAPAITINIGSANLAKLTDEQIAIATSKNYTLV